MTRPLLSSHTLQLGKIFHVAREQSQGGIVKHPETNLWQIWMMDDGPWDSLGAYRDPGKAQRNLEVIINTIRQGTTIAKAKALYRQLLSEADGEVKELPYDMLLYLGEHYERFMIKL
jgi:hypothetical protein